MSQEISAQQPLILNLVSSQAFKADMFSALSAVFLLDRDFVCLSFGCSLFGRLFGFKLIKQTLMATTRSIMAL